MTTKPYLIRVIEERKPKLEAIITELERLCKREGGAEVTKQLEYLWCEKKGEMKAYDYLINRYEHDQKEGGKK